MSPALPQKFTDWFVYQQMDLLLHTCIDMENCAASYLYAWEDSSSAFIRRPQRKKEFCSLLLRWLGELIHLTSRAHAASSPVMRCTVWLGRSGQQLQEEEMETLHCHRASFSAKEQLIPETASRRERLSKDSRGKRQTKSNDQPPLGQGVVYKQAITGVWRGRRRLPAKQNVLFWPSGDSNAGAIRESCWDTSALSRSLSVTNVVLLPFKRVSENVTGIKGDLIPTKS